MNKPTSTYVERALARIASEAEEKASDEATTVRAEFNAAGRLQSGAILTEMSKRLLAVMEAEMTIGVLLAFNGGG